MQPPATTSQETSSSSSANTTFGHNVNEPCDSTCQSSKLSAGQPQPQAASLPVWAVPHVRQSFNWDCGLACALMVLKSFGLHQYDMAYLMRICPTKSIWTIDLAHVLSHCGALVTFITVTIGANPSYAGARFYAENMAEDEARVARLFRDAPAAGIVVEQRSVSLLELQAVLQSFQHLVIVLVDKNKLCSSPTLPATLPIGPVLATGTPPAPEPAYTGHYVLVCGYDPRSDCFYVHDPASVHEQLQVTACTLDAARKCFGTDEDLLVVTVPLSMRGTGCVLA